MPYFDGWTPSCLLYSNSRLNLPSAITYPWFSISKIFCSKFLINSLLFLLPMTMMAAQKKNVQILFWTWSVVVHGRAVTRNYVAIHLAAFTLFEPVLNKERFFLFPKAVHTQRKHAGILAPQRPTQNLAQMHVTETRNGELTAKKSFFSPLLHFSLHEHVTWTISRTIGIAHTIPRVIMR